MPGLDNHAAPVAILHAQADLPAPVADPVSHLAAVYRDYPGLRALILRRVGDAEVAADILQDAAVTTLEKLRSGEIAHPENLGGYLYRVALNHLRNHRRKDRSPASSADAVEDLRDAEDDPDWARVGRPQWARAARRMLEEIARDRCDQPLCLGRGMRDPGPRGASRACLELRRGCGPCASEGDVT
ncbi:MAG: sigma-70 family RNA polymerase sigma factor [Gammaproteobacteria bacterium]|nr:MAG: sigma-70 family RNA polymerase sigma factor [Gammaproteobacteria bacterium]